MQFSKVEQLQAAASKSDAGHAEDIKFVSVKYTPPVLLQYYCGTGVCRIVDVHAVHMTYCACNRVCYHSPGHNCRGYVCIMFHITH